MRLEDARVGMRVRLVGRIAEGAPPENRTGTIIKIAPTVPNGDSDHDFDVFWGMAFPIEVKLDNVEYSDPDRHHNPATGEQWYDTFSPKELEEIA